MDVAESPERDPRSPEDEEEEQQGLSDDDILRESASDQDVDKAAGRASDLEDEENAVLGLSQEEEESRSDEEDEDQDSEPQELHRGPTSPPHAEEGGQGEEDHTSDLRDEASSVTMELDKHELDYDEEVPEEPAPTGQEDEAEKAGAEEDEETGEGAPEKEGKADVHSVEGKEPLEAAKEKKKEDDDGEIDDDDLEEGEVKDPSDRKVRPRPTCRFFLKDVKGNCTWGMNCRFIHPGVDDKGNYSLITKAEPFRPKGAPPLGPHPRMPANPWGGPVVDEMLPPPPPEPPTESVWERGLRRAKEVLKKATIRKEQEPDFEEKRFTVTIGEDEREFDKENAVFRDWNYRITRDVRDTTLEPYADPYHGYERNRFRRGGQYENFWVRYTATEPRQNSRERERESERENRQRERERDRARDKELRPRREEWEQERAKRDEDRQHRDREKEREKEKEKPKPRSPQPPSRHAEPKKEAVSSGPQVKPAEEWKDPWRRSKSPKKKLGASASPSRARRHRRPSASSASASHASRSSSRSSSSSGSGSSRSRSWSSSYSSCSSRSSGHNSFSGSRSRSRSFSSSPSHSPTPFPPRPAVRAKGEPALPPGKAGEKMVQKPAPPQAPRTAAPTPAPAKPGGPREARRRERHARTPARRRTSRGSGSGYSDMYADLASAVPPASSRAPTRAQTDKEKAGKSKREDGLKEDQRNRDATTRPPKSSKSSAGRQSSQQPTAPQRAPSGQPPQGACAAHKEIKVTLLNKVAGKGSRKRDEPSDKDRLSPPPAKRAHVSPDPGSRAQTSGGSWGSPRPGWQRGQNAQAPVALPDRKRPLSPQSESSSQVTSVPGKASDASTGTKSGRASTLSRQEELLKQLKAVENAIARKQAKIPRKV